MPDRRPSLSVLPLIVRVVFETNVSSAQRLTQLLSIQISACSTSSSSSSAEQRKLKTHSKKSTDKKQKSKNKTKQRNTEYYLAFLPIKDEKKAAQSFINSIYIICLLPSFNLTLLRSKNERSSPIFDYFMSRAALLNLDTRWVHFSILKMFCKPRICPHSHLNIHAFSFTWKQRKQKKKTERRFP